MFIHLHNHSIYSLLDGACPLEELVSRAVKFGMPAVAITDHGNLHGAIEFYEIAKSAGIKPIIGQEFYVAPESRHKKRGQKSEVKSGYHLTVIAKDNAGFKNLMRLSSIGFLEGFYYKPRIDKEILAELSEGLIVLSGCLHGEIPWLLARDRFDEAKSVARWFLDIFGTENFFIELQYHNIPEELDVMKKLIRLAKEMGIRMVATNDVHYINREDHDFHDKMLCIQTDSRLDDPNRLRFQTDEFYFKSPQEMMEIFGEVPEAIQSTVSIAERVDVSIETGKLHLPEFPVPPEFSSVDEYLSQKAWEGLRRRYSRITKKLEQRLEYELDVIKRMNFSSYFAIVADFTDKARELGVSVGPGRGSGAGSLVAYCLGITNIDPMKYNLLFERFLNPERISMPDFDIDFDDENREKVIEYAKHRYGENSVSQIITFSRMKARQAIKDVGRIFGLSFRDTNALTSLVLTDSIEESLRESPELAALYEEDPKIRQVLNYAMKIEGFPRNAGVHAAGVVITPGNLTDYVPLFRTAKGEVTTQYDKDSLEKIGLLKMDFLGLTTLSIIRETVRLVKTRTGKDIEPENFPEKDPKVFELMSRGDTIGIFQFESDGMRKYLRLLKPDSINDLIAMNALYRPGPMKFIESFINRKHGREEVKYPHPYVEDILKETYGIALYQEQVMLLAQKLAGYSLGEADLLRRAIGKKDMHAMERHRETFIERAKKKGISEKVAREVFEIIAKFAEYGFNKSHSTAYAVLAYQTAYLKAHYPREFLAANLSSWAKRPDKVQKFLNECARLGIKVFPPDINKSDEKFTVEKDGIRFGLCAIENLGHAAIRAILSAREKVGKFKDIYHFFESVDGQVLNRRGLESLVASGAFDSLGVKRASLMASLDNLIKWKQQISREKSAKLASLFGDDDSTAMRPTLVDVPEWNKWKLLNMEKSALGVYVTGHPMDYFELDVKAFTSGTISDIVKIQRERRARIAGLISSITRKRTNDESQMAIVTLQDRVGEIKVIFYPKIFDKAQMFLAVDALVWVEGLLQFDPDGTPVLKAEKAMPIEILRREMCSQLHIKISENTPQKKLVRIKQLLSKNKGDKTLVIHIESENKSFSAISKSIKVNAENDLTEMLIKELGRENVWLA